MKVYFATATPIDGHSFLLSLIRHTDSWTALGFTVSRNKRSIHTAVQRLNDPAA